MSTEDWHAIIGTNLTGVFFCTRAALPHLKQRGGGYIINISSLASKNAFAGGGAYCASKAALNSFTETLMLETRHDNIRVSDVLPGSVQTEFNNNASRPAPTGSSPPTTSRAPSSTCSRIRRGACRAASSCGRRSRRRRANPPHPKPLSKERGLDFRLSAALIASPPE